MYGIVVKFVVITGCIVACCYLIASIFRRSRMITQKLAELREEEAAMKAAGKVIDPYKALAELYRESKSGTGKSLFKGKKEDGLGE